MGLRRNIAIFVRLAETGMKTVVSRIFFSLAAFMMLLMSAVPHHHHCLGYESSGHADYICFSGEEHEDALCCYEDCTDGSCAGHHDGHGTERCRLHSIVTLLERIQNIPSYQPALEAVFPQNAPEIQGVQDAADKFSVPLSERATSYYLARAKGMRAPPAAQI